MKREKKNLLQSLAFLSSFCIWTAIIRLVDVNSIGPNGSSVGLSKLNGFFHGLTGVNMWLYTLTDWLGLVPIAVALIFAVLGLCQWIKRKNILKVDFSLLILGVYYIVVIIAYVIFEKVVINYRPILIEGYLEASYPSSTTMLVLCVMGTTLAQINERIKNKKAKLFVRCIIVAFTLFMVIGRLISGVHWLSDIVGGVLLSFGLIKLYDFICRSCKD